MEKLQITNANTAVTILSENSFCFKREFQPCPFVIGNQKEFFLGCPTIHSPHTPWVSAPEQFKLQLQTILCHVHSYLDQFCIFPLIIASSHKIKGKLKYQKKNLVYYCCFLKMCDIDLTNQIIDVLFSKPS